MKKFDDNITRFIIVQSSKSIVCAWLFILYPFLVNIATGQDRSYNNEDLANRFMIFAPNQISEPSKEALNKMISLDYEELTVEKALQTIAEIGDIKLVYSKNVTLIDYDRPVNVRFDTATVLGALYGVLELSGNHHLRLVLSDERRIVIVRVDEIEEYPDKSSTLDIQGGKKYAAIRGQVVEHLSEEPLIGANIVVIGTSIGAVSDRNGKFRIGQISSGTYNLQVSYLGYQTEIKNVDVQPGEDVRVSFSLSSTLIEGEEVVVSGILRGQSRALQKQRAAPSSRRIVSSEIMDQHGDDNIIGTIGRLPGARLRYDEGDRVSLLLRGVNSNRINVTMDGMSMASNLEGSRGTQLGAISSDMIESLEIINAQTPDMDAASLSGTINLVTHPVTSREADWRIRTRSDYTLRPDRPNEIYHIEPILSIRYRQRVSDRVSIQLLGDYRQRTRDTDRVDVDWMTIGPDDNGFWSEKRSSLFMMSSYQPTNELVGYEQYNFNSTITYSYSENTWFYVRGLLSRQWVNDHYRVRERPRFNEGSFLNVSEEDREVIVTNYRIDSEYLKYDRTNGNDRLMIGGETHLLEDLLQTDFSIGSAKGYTFEIDRWNYDFRNNNVHEETMVQLGTGQVPTVKLTGEAKNPANFHLRRITRDESDGRDNNYFANLNFKVTDIGLLDGFMKFGGQFQYRNNINIPKRYRYEWSGFEDIKQDQFLTGNTRISVNTLTPNWDWGPGFDHDKFQKFFIMNYNDFDLDLDSYSKRYSQSSESFESIYAAYIMPVLNFGRANLIGGLRMEATQAETSGNEVMLNRRRDIESIEKRTANINYIDFFPSVHLNHAITDNWLGRVSVATGLQRPGFSDWTPGFSEDRSRERLTVGNPSLKPEYSTKYEIQLEHYLNDQVGFFSIGGFYLDVNNMIFEQNVAIDLESGDFEGFEDYQYWELRQPRNIKEAYIAGVELVWQQQLTFLPGLFKHLGLYSNYTYMYSEMMFEHPLKRKVMIPDMPPHEFNITLNYERSRFYGQISGLYMHQHIERHIRDTYIYNSRINYFDSYENTLYRLDASFLIRITKSIRFTVNAVNILNSPYRNRYLKAFPKGELDHPNLFYRQGEGGITGSFGLQINL
ncbi:MAG: TonB-dependent receptor [Balneolales bacterium]